MPHPFWQNGFRPFFLSAALWAAAMMVGWIFSLVGMVDMSGVMTPVDWHMHELLFGFVPAVIAGFLLTAIPNWTGRTPVRGRQLMALFALWLAGRAGLAFVMLSPECDGLAAVVIIGIALAFLPVLVARMGYELVASGNKRNLKVLIAIVILWLANILFLLEATVLEWEVAGYGYRLAFTGILFLVMLIGGRIIPAFTRNWLRQRQVTANLPDFNRLDKIAAFSSLAILLVWTLLPDYPATGMLALIAAPLQMLRLVRWQGWRCGKEPLIYMLHIAYLFIPAGFILLALGILFPDLVDYTAALHAWAVGCIATMILVVMTRATLGHSGRALASGWGINSMLALITLAAITRILAAFDLSYTSMLHLSATAWIFAFALFVILFLPVMVKARVDG